MIMSSIVTPKPNVMEEAKIGHGGGAGNGIVEVNPQPYKGLTSTLIDWIEKIIVKSMAESTKPHHFLSGSFSPVRHETPPTNHLHVTGDIPKCLNGEFARVGPNPKFSPSAGYHWFDGDGMVHGVRIKDGKATYVSRYVRTSRLKQEEFFGEEKYAKIADLKGLFGVFKYGLQILREKLGILDSLYGFGTANTALAFHDGKLLVLHEGDKPYVLKVLEDGDLQTLGMIDYDKRLGHAFTAHPKIDPVTGEMFTFGYSQTEPFLTYRVISKDGFMNEPVNVTISDVIMMHDFAITENYAIFMDLPLIFSPKEMVKQKKLAYFFNAAKKARFGVLPRYAKDELLIKWFELPNCFIFHNANAWEDGDEVVLISSRLEDVDMGKLCGVLDENREHFVSELYEMRFNMKTGEATQRKLSESCVEFPRLNESYTGRKQRYIYATRMGKIGKITGIVKFDLNAEPESDKTSIEIGGNVQGLYDLGSNCYGSEAVFVPRVPQHASEEDDGYLVLFVHDENSGKSAVHVIDAKTMLSEPVAIIDLPHRVPPGFHALFVSEEQLQEAKL